MNRHEIGDCSADTHCSSIVVIGYGNPLRSDDGIGWRIAEVLRGRFDSSGIEVIQCHELTPEMAENMRRAALVIFMDAATDGFPGEVRQRRLSGSGMNDSSPALSHGLTPEALLALAAHLYGASPDAHLFTVCGRSFCHGENFSPEVARAFPSVVAAIEGLLVEQQGLAFPPPEISRIA